MGCRGNGRQSWRSNGQRFGLASILVWFRHGLVLKRGDKPRSYLVCSDELPGAGNGRPFGPPFSSPLSSRGN